jgi:hypothetical protein
MGESIGDKIEEFFELLSDTIDRFFMKRNIDNVIREKRVEQELLRQLIFFIHDKALRELKRELAIKYQDLTPEQIDELNLEELLNRMQNNPDNAQNIIKDFAGKYDIPGLEEFLKSYLEIPEIVLLKEEGVIYEAVGKVLKGKDFDKIRKTLKQYGDYGEAWDETFYNFIFGIFDMFCKGKFAVKIKCTAQEPPLYFYFTIQELYEVYPVFPPLFDQVAIPLNIERYSQYLEEMIPEALEVTKETHRLAKALSSFQEKFFLQKKRIEQTVEVFQGFIGKEVKDGRMSLDEAREILNKWLAVIKEALRK